MLLLGGLSPVDLGDGRADGSRAVLGVIAERGVEALWSAPLVSRHRLQYLLRPDERAPLHNAWHAVAHFATSLLVVLAVLAIVPHRAMADTYMTSSGADAVDALVGFLGYDAVTYDEAVTKAVNGVEPYTGYDGLTYFYGTMYDADAINTVGGAHRWTSALDGFAYSWALDDARSDMARLVLQYKADKMPDVGGGGDGPQPVGATVLVPANCPAINMLDYKGGTTSKKFKNYVSLSANQEIYEMITVRLSADIVAKVNDFVDDGWTPLFFLTGLTNTNAGVNLGVYFLKDYRFGTATNSNIEYKSQLFGTLHQTSVSYHSNSNHIETRVNNGVVDFSNCTLNTGYGVTTANGSGIGHNYLLVVDGGIGDDEPSEPVEPNYPTPPDDEPPTITPPDVPTTQPTGGSNTYYYTTNNNYTTGDVDLQPILDAIEEVNYNIGILNDNMEELSDFLFDAINDIQGRLHDLHAMLDAWLEEFADFFSDYFDIFRKQLANMNRWLESIFYRIGRGGSSQPDPYTEPFDFWKWLGKLIDDLVGQLPEGAASFAAALGQLTGRFPFSVPWDMAAMLGLLAHEPVTPEFSIWLPAWSGGQFVGAGYELQMDLSQWDGIAALARRCELLLFAFGLASWSVGAMRDMEWTLFD